MVVAHCMSQYPKPIQVHIEAEGLLRKYGLKEQGWKFELSNRKTFVGTCFYGRKVIAYSKYYLTDTEWDEIRNTLLHEIAHALTPGHGHDDVWKCKAIEIGARPERCARPDR